MSKKGREHRARQRCGRCVACKVRQLDDPEVVAGLDRLEGSLAELAEALGFEPGEAAQLAEALTERVIVKIAVDESPVAESLPPADRTRPA